jgi:hypothetical protein
LINTGIGFEVEFVNIYVESERTNPVVPTVLIVSEVSK